MRFITTATTFAVALVASATAASAQTTVRGTTYGCFGSASVCNAESDFTSTARYMIGDTGTSIEFMNAGFAGTTNPVTNGFTVGNFGSLVLNGLDGETMNTTFSTPFTLLFELTAPAGANDPQTRFRVFGFVGSTNDTGTRDIAYASSSTEFTFNGGTGTITTDGGHIGPRATDISGRITAASTVPEPSTYAMMGMGLTGLVTVARRRRSTTV